MAALLEVKDLKTRFHTPEGTVYAVNGISFHVGRRGNAGGGWGKRLWEIRLHALGFAVDPGSPGRDCRRRGFLPRQIDLLKMSESEMEDIRGKEIAMIFQDPMTSSTRS